jgi:hypothetical protein
MLTPDQAWQLREAGLTAYNHNLDTSPEYYGKITTTRKYEDRLATLEAVREAGGSQHKTLWSAFLQCRMLKEKSHDGVALVWAFKMQPTCLQRCRQTLATTSLIVCDCICQYNDPVIYCTCDCMCLGRFNAANIMHDCLWTSHTVAKFEARCDSHTAGQLPNT